MRTSFIFLPILLLGCSVAPGPGDSGPASDAGNPPDSGAPTDGGLDAGLPAATFTLLSPGPDDLLSPLQGAQLALEVTQRGELALQLLDEQGQVVVQRSAQLNGGRETMTLTPQEIASSGSGQLTVVLNGVSYPRRVGVTFLVAGQSNSANWECLQCLPANSPVIRGDRLSFLKDESVPMMPDLTMSPLMNVMPVDPLPALGLPKWIPYADTVEGVMPIANGRLRGLWPAVIDQLAVDKGWHFRVIAIGVGSTSIAQWAKPDYLFQRFGYLPAANAVDAVLWVQGETDAIVGTTTDDYKAQLLLIQQNAEELWMKHLSVKPPWVLFLTTGGPVCGASAAGKTQIRGALTQLAAEHPATFLLGPDFDLIPHDCHFDTAPQFSAAVQATSDELRRLFPGL